jgi:hypothetical protein
MRLVSNCALAISVTLSLSSFAAQIPASHADASPCSRSTQQISSEQLMGIVITKKPIRTPMYEPTSRLHGIVIVRVCVTKKGQVFSARILDGNPIACGPVIDSVREWVFKPYRVHWRSQAVFADLKVPYDFRSPPSKRSS